MIHHAVRLKVTVQPSLGPFQAILLDAAARAYVRVRSWNRCVDVLQPRAGPSSPLRADIGAVRSHASASRTRTPSGNWIHRDATFAQARQYSSQARSSVALIPPIPQRRRHLAKARAPHLPPPHLPNSRPPSDVPRVFNNPQRPRWAALRVRGSVDPDTLSEHEVIFEDPARTPSYTFNDEPKHPPNLSPSLRSTNFKPVVAIEKSAPILLQPSSSPTSTGFVRQLLLRSLASPSATLTSVLSTHHSFRDYASTESYNLLLILAIRHAAYGTAHRLLQEMRRSHIRGDIRTWQLRARLLVREGRWADAWKLVMNAEDDWVAAPFVPDGIPIVVWAELLGTQKRGTMRRKDNHGRLVPAQGLDEGMVSLSRYGLVMRQQLKLALPPAGPTGPPSRVVYASVDALLRMKERRMAQNLTLHFLQQDPQGLGLRLLHLHLCAAPNSYGENSYWRAVRNYNGYIATCPSLQPNATTLFTLLSHLQYARQPATLACNLMEYFRRRWGNRVISPRVRRRLLALAVKEGRQDLMHRILTAGRVMSHAVRMWAIQREVLGVRERRYSKHTHAKSGTERISWKRAARRARRFLRRVDGR